MVEQEMSCGCYINVELGTDFDYLEQGVGVGEYRALWRGEVARWPIPAVFVYHGSVYQHMVWGFTQWHAIRRADRYIMERKQ